MNGRARAFSMLVLVLSLAAGCGSNGGPQKDSGGSGGGGGLGTATLTWTEDATARTALSASSSLLIDTMVDLLQVAGSDATGTGLAISIAAPPPLMPGTYACAETGTGSRIVTMTYSLPDDTPMVSVCTITLIALGRATGERAVGTFSATVSLTDGGTRTVTEGTFDAPVTVTQGGR